MKQHFYALGDSSCGIYPKDYCTGFEHAREVFAFESKAAREIWLKNTKFLPARALTAREAIQYARKKYDPPASGEHVIFIRFNQYQDDTLYIARIIK